MASTATVDDLTMQRDRKNLEAMDDVTLVYVMLGLNGEMEGVPGWGRTAQARSLRRVAFTEIARRWIPADVFGAAFRELMGEENVDPDANPREDAPDA